MRVRHNGNDAVMSGMGPSGVVLTGGRYLAFGRTSIAHRASVSRTGQVECGLPAGHRRLAAEYVTVMQLQLHQRDL